MYSTVYSVKTYSRSFRAIVIGSFFHFPSIERIFLLPAQHYLLWDMYANVKNDRKNIEKIWSSHLVQSSSLTHKVLCLRGLGDQDNL